jgi:hypothetical protein
MSDVTLELDLINEEITLVVDGPVQLITTTGSLPYRHTQTTAAAEWVVAHNLNRPANGQAYDGAGNRVGCDIQEFSLNVMKFNFLEPRNGFAVIN